MDHRARLESVDELGARVLDRLRPIRFRVAQSAAERESVFRLRYRVAVEDGLASRAELPQDGLEREPADERAVLIGAWNAELLVATARLVLPERGHPLPIEAHLGMVFEPPGEVVEWTRMAVAPEFRGRDHAVFLGLICACWLSMRARGYSVGAGAMTADVLSRWRKLGVELTAVGRPRRYWNEERYPVLFDAAIDGAAIDTWARTQPVA